MNRTTVHKNSVVVLESVVAHTLENSLSDGNNRHIVNSIPYLVVTIKRLFLSRYLHVFNELSIKIHFRTNSQEYLDRQLNLLLHQSANSIVFTSRPYPKPIFLSLVLPPIRLQISDKSQHLPMLAFNIFHEPHNLVLLSLSHIRQLKIDISALLLG